jgi:amino acid adenylation domain-containing protein
MNPQLHCQPAGNLGPYLPDTTPPDTENCPMAATCQNLDTRGGMERYPLAPLQEGMLFHSLCAPHAGFEIEQLVGALREELDVHSFKQAWHRVTERHAVLRTDFHWEGLIEPVQWVREHAALRWAEQDWSDSPPAEREKAFRGFLETDRLCGFDAAEAPLSRVTLFRLGPSEFRFVWTFHHALLDGRSFPTVLREVFTFYEAFRHGKDLDLPLPPKFRDHISWVRRQDLGPAESFWRERLKGFAAPTPLAIGSIGQAGAPSRHSAEELLLSAPATSALQSLAHDYQLTLNILVQGAWALLLHRYSGEAEVVFGATRACRKSSIAGAESIVGLLINTLPVRVPVPEEKNLLSWLKDLRAQWNSLRAFEHTPLVKIQGWSEVPPESSLFESIVVFENFDLNTLLRSQGGAWANREFQLFERPAYPLMLAVYSDSQLRLKIEFDTSRFEVPAIQRLLGHLQNLLGAMADDPHQPLGKLPMLSREEQHQLLVEWNEPRLHCPAEFCLHELFEAQVKRTPDASALVCADQQLTYGELNEQANAVAHHLRDLGVGPETLVAVYLERSVDLIVALLGIVKAGGAYLPIDSTCPRERLAFMLQDSQATALVTHSNLAAGFSAGPMAIVCLDAPGLLRKKAASDPCSGATPANLAYVIYTSGSTGQPKGVMVTHQNVARLFQATAQWFHFNPRDVWTLFHSPAFDFSVWEMWGALLFGGKLVIVPHRVSRSPQSFHDLLVREQVTVLNQTPSAFRQLIQADQQQPTQQTGRPNLALRLVIFGGEALDPQSLRPWFDRHGDERPELVNMYGITETTVHVTYRPLKKEDLRSRSVIGVPIPDLQLYLLDACQRPVPIGVPGEVHVGGAGLARGYLNRPELTAERFVAHPFSSDPGARLYKSGDRARYLPGREIEYLGRVDAQVKVRGFRIEPGEIESTLCQHPTVREAVVLLREDKPGDQRLIAYVARSRPAVDDLREFLKVRIPDYMIPSVIVTLEKLPLTRNGKIDRRALPAPGPEFRDAGQPFAAPRTKLERSIAGIWQDLLGVKKVGLQDNFFEMGGHSLLLVQLHYRLQAELSRVVPITTLFQYPTIRALSEHLSAEPALSARKAQQRLRRMQELQEIGV